MASTRDDTPTGDDPVPGSARPLVSIPTSPAGTSAELLRAIDRHPTALGRHLDNYLAAVVRELQISGVLTGSPQRSDPSHRLLGSIVLDCTALPTAARTPPASLTTEPEIADPPSPGSAVRPGRPAPVVATWNEDTGWCVGLHHDSTHSSRLYLHPDLLPRARTVADFVVGLAQGRELGSDHPISPAGRPRLRLVP